MIQNILKYLSSSFADRVIAFNQQLNYSGQVIDGFEILNPFLDNPETMVVMKQFYHQYYDDHHKRKFIIGINPSRHGAGVTGVPFTDTKRLKQYCGIAMQSAHTHELSSVFMYDMIAAYGGVDVFYKDFYINSPFPLAIVKSGRNNNWVNANYYDDKTLFHSVKDFMIASLRKHISLGLHTDEVFVLGKKNTQYLQQLNDEAQLFGKLTTLEHPRYIQQYKSRDRDAYIDKYLQVLLHKD